MHHDHEHYDMSSMRLPGAPQHVQRRLVGPVKPWGTTTAAAGKLVEHGAGPDDIRARSSSSTRASSFLAATSADGPTAGRRREVPGTDPGATQLRLRDEAPRRERGLPTTCLAARRSGPDHHVLPPRRAPQRLLPFESATTLPFPVPCSPVQASSIARTPAPGRTIAGWRNTGHGCPGWSSERAAARASRGARGGGRRARADVGRIGW